MASSCSDSSIFPWPNAWPDFKQFGASSKQIRRGALSSLRHIESGFDRYPDAVARACLHRTRARASRRLPLIQPEPVKRVRPERQEIRLIADRREIVTAQQFDWRPAAKCPQIERGWLGELRQIVHAQHRLILVLAQVRDDPPVLARHELERPPAEDRILFAHP